MPVAWLGHHIFGLWIDYLNCFGPLWVIDLSLSCLEIDEPSQGSVLVLMMENSLFLSDAKDGLGFLQKLS